ncbi:hypothetical protein BJ166DRAFT_269230 [Pestalotiopsis sp. NC0098]|nr:hypothetical protein BJ166DRAFT_269230 [Pestalotiopsis sp. NC0098]
MKSRQQSKDGTLNEDRYTGEAQLYLIIRGGCLAARRCDVGLYASHRDMIFRQRRVAVLVRVVPGDDDGVRRRDKLVAGQVAGVRDARDLVADEQGCCITESLRCTRHSQTGTPTPRHSSVSRARRPAATSISISQPLWPVAAMILVGYAAVTLGPASR